MGHDHHFLSRLDRVNAQHVELALGLYRDEDLVRRILQMADVPEQADRVAISLDDPNRGPYVLVARSGHFVTCLGKGMKVSGAHVVTRERLNAIGEYLHELRDRMQTARRLSGDGAISLLRSVFESGDRMSRETFRGILPVVEMVRFDFMRWLGQNLAELPGMLADLNKTVAAPHNDKKLRAFWQLAWSHAHLELLFGSEWQPGTADPLLKLDGDDDARLLISRTAVGLAWLPMAVRGLHVGALAGDRFVDELARDWVEANKLGHMLHAMFLLVRIANEMPELRNPVRAILSKPPGQETVLADAFRQFHAHYLPFIHRLLEDRELELAEFMRGSREIVVRSGEHLPIGAEARFLLEHEVPDPLARAMAARMSGNVLDLTLGTGAMLALSAWFAGASSEEFYPPEDYLRSLNSLWYPKKTQKIVEIMIDGFDRPQGSAPARQKANERCACGSGKKFKRCCGAPGAARQT
jgi:hypothetical protein